MPWPRTRRRSTRHRRRGPDLRGARWIEPRLVIRAELGGWTRDGLVRQSAFKGIDDGREPSTVVRETPVASSVAEAEVDRELGQSGDPPGPDPAGDASRRIGGPQARRARPAPPRPEWAPATADELAALDRLGKDGTWTVGGVELKLTNLDKVLFPPADASPDDRPVVKRELIAYFGRIAPAMLPHLDERPLNLQRFPDGADRAGVLAEGPPADRSDLAASLARGRASRLGPRTRHLVADRTATLCWLGNQAAFEIHAWTSRLTAPDRPTFALIDIDPGERTTWAETLVLARLFRTALGHLGVRGYPKLTGKRGIQVWIPIEPRYGYDETSAWVEGVSRAVGATVPELVSWEWSKDRRDGRARLDYTQNTYIKTLVAPYAVRPAPGAPVSAPDRLGRARRSDPQRPALDDPDDARPGRRPSATCSRPPRPTSRSCPGSDGGRGHHGAAARSLERRGGSVGRARRAFLVAPAGGTSRAIRREPVSPVVPARSRHQRASGLRSRAARKSSGSGSGSGRGGSAPAIA